MTNQVAYKWQPISDLPGNHGSLSSSELRVLADVWIEQRDQLKATGAMEDFLQRLVREWAIETGIIERVYALDRGITQLLIERGIDATLIPHSATDKNPDLVAAMIKDHQEAIEGIFDFVKGMRPLSTSYIKELHSVLTRHQATSTAVDTLGRTVEVPLLRGGYKTLPNNPLRSNGTIHEYCPPEHVASEIDRLVAMHLEHEQKAVSPEVEAGWLHHAFTQIHPFQDGNGRVARAMATLVFVKASWFPLLITRDDRDRYIRALESADAGDLTELLRMFSGIQRRTFVKGLGIAGQVRQRERMEQVIAATRDLLERRRISLLEQFEKAKHTARELQTLASQSFQDLATRLQADVGSLSDQFRFYVDSEPDGGARRYYFRFQVIETAKALDYFANAGVYHAWTRLILRTEGQAEILLSFHGIGHEYRGVLVASLCYYQREQTEQGERQLANVVSVSDDFFQINYREDLAQARPRFKQWLDQSLVKALEIWRSAL